MRWEGGGRKQVTFHLWRRVTLLVLSPGICMLPLQLTKLTSQCARNNSEKFNLELIPQWFALSLCPDVIVSPGGSTPPAGLGLGFESGEIHLDKG